MKGCFLTILLLVYLLLGDDNDVFSKKIVDTFDFSYFSLGRFILFRVTCAVSLWENICLFRDGKVEKFPDVEKIMVWSLGFLCRNTYSVGIFSVLIITFQ